MKRNGFTLVELLAVIAILTALLVIVVPAVQNTIQESKDKLYDVTVSEIEKAAKQYTIKYINDIDGLIDTGIGYVTLGDITDKDILESPVKNPKTGNPFDEDKVVVEIVKIQKENGAYIYQYTFLIDGIPNG